MHSILHFTLVSVVTIRARSISYMYLVYSVILPTCMFLITYLVYSENYHVCLLITRRTNHSGEINHSRQGFMTINNPCPQAAPLGCTLGAGSFIIFVYCLCLESMRA